MSLERVALDSDELHLEVLPALGGKVSVLRRHDGDNVLLSPPEYAHRVPDADGAFDAHDTSGFDECFPTVAACHVGSRALPDHGQVWSRPARVSREGGALRVVSELPGSIFSRMLRLVGDTLRVEYEARGEAAPALWSSHPLLSVRPGMQILLPRSVTSMFVEWSANGLERGSTISWPVHAGVRLDELLPPTAGRAHKLFTDVLEDGACALYDPATDAAVTFRFDPREVPCIGLWVTEGGWPTTRASKHYTVALEPCSGRPDSLAEAIALGTSFAISPEPRRWSLMMSISRGRPTL